MIVAILLTIAATWVFSEAVGYLIHWSAHNVNNTLLQRTHMTHHLTHYPPGKYISDVYISAGKDSFVFWFAPVVVLLMLTALWLLPWVLGIVACGTMLTVSFVNDYMHTQFHLTNTPFRHWRWFKRLRAIHFIHHRDMYKNLAIYLPTIDKLAGTYKGKLP
jgi:hypothetical protein